MTAVSATIEIAVPPQRVWEVIMDPSHFDDWVTIHRLRAAGLSARRTP